MLQQLKNHISVHFFFSFLPFSFEWAWRAVAHGACGVLNMCSHGVLNRPFIAGKFSLRAPNKLPPYPYETTTLHLLKNHTAPTNYHTTSTKYYRHELQTKNHKSPNQHHQKKRKEQRKRRKNKRGDIAGGEAAGGVRAPAHGFLILPLISDHKITFLLNIEFGDWARKWRQSLGFKIKSLPGGKFATACKLLQPFAQLFQSVQENVQRCAMCTFAEKCVIVWTNVY